MAKINKEEEWRRSGIGYALKVAREKGIEGLEDEVKFRNITKCPLCLSKDVAVEYFQDIQKNCATSFNLLALLTLHDEFGFSTKRLERFYKRFTTKAECIIEGYTNWEEASQIILEECKIKIDLPEALKNFQTMMETERVE